MLTLSPAFYPFLVMVIPAIAGLVLFWRIYKNQLLHTRQFFVNYALGFGLLSLVNLPVFIINLGLFKISYSTLVALYTISFFAVLFAYLLFYKATVSLYSNDKFFSFVPFIIAPFFAILLIGSLFIIKVETSILYTVGVWGFLIPLDALLGCLFIYFFVKGAPLDTGKGLVSNLLLSIAWFLLLILEVYLWLNVAVYPQQKFWILKIASMDGWFLARSFAYLLLLIGSLLYSKRLQKADHVRGKID